jgi:hypothetical protein
VRTIKQSSSLGHPYASSTNFSDFTFDRSVRLLDLGLARAVPLTDMAAYRATVVASHHTNSHNGQTQKVKHNCTCRGGGDEIVRAEKQENLRNISDFGFTLRPPNRRMHLLYCCCCSFLQLFLVIFSIHHRLAFSLSSSSSSSFCFLVGVSPTSPTR